MVVEKIYIAELHPDSIARYKELHDSIPTQIELHLREDGIIGLDIFLAGAILCMVIKRDESLAERKRNFNQAAEEAWQHVTGSCFKSKWRTAERVYSLFK